MIENLDSLIQTVEGQLARVFPDARSIFDARKPYPHSLKYGLGNAQEIYLAYTEDPNTGKIRLHARLFVNLRLEAEDTLDPAIESDLIGGFAYFKQILDTNQMTPVHVQAPPTPPPISDFPTGTYRATRFFALKRAHDPGGIGFDSSNSINITSKNGVTLANGQPVDLKNLWNAYRQEYLNPVDVPSAHVKTTYPLTINVKDSSEVLQFDSDATFDIGSGYILMPDGSLISVLPTEQLSLLERRLLIIVP